MEYVDTDAYSRLPTEVLLLVCQASDRKTLGALQHVSSEWRYLALPLLWRTIEVSDWEHIATATTVHSLYGRYVHAIEYRQYRRRRGNSGGASSPQLLSTAEGKTKTDVACEWLGLPWPKVKKVAIGAWPPYNIARVQSVLSSHFPRLSVLVLEGAAAAWIDTLQRAVTTHPNLQGLHITEDNRALLPPAAEMFYKRLETRFCFLTGSGCARLTHLTVPCSVGSAAKLLAELPVLLPTLTSLDLRQVDAGSVNGLFINLSPQLKTLKITGQYPLSIRMFEPQYPRTGSIGASRDSSASHITTGLHSLSVTGLRSEEAANRELEQFWRPVLQHKCLSLTKVVLPVAHPELGRLISCNCPNLKHLRFLHAGSSIDPVVNDEWVSELTRLPRLQYIDIASSNNEYEGCSLSPRLVTNRVWNARWLQIMYTSRLVLSVDTLELLLSMLPFLHTLWFTFDCSSTSASEKISHSQREIIHLRYLVIHAVTGSRPPGSTSRANIPALVQALSECLQRFPSVNRCRLPMFTFPDDQRHWLQCQFPGVDFKKYAPPF